jgi:hypothetical protein
MTIVNDIAYEPVTGPDDPDDYRPGSPLALVFDPGDDSGRAVRNLHFIYEVAAPGEGAPLHVHPVDEAILVRRRPDGGMGRRHGRPGRSRRRGVYPSGSPPRVAERDGSELHDRALSLVGRLSVRPDRGAISSVAAESVRPIIPNPPNTAPHFGAVRSRPDFLAPLYMGPVFGNVPCAGGLCVPRRPTQSERSRRCGLGHWVSGADGTAARRSRCWRRCWRPGRAGRTWGRRRTAGCPRPQRRGTSSAGARRSGRAA